jgi:hypothetical protein
VGSRRAPVWAGLVLTALAWLVDRAVITATWGPARNPLLFDPYLWGRVDSINYLGIAQHGRSFGRCGQPGFPTSYLTQGLHLQWCGTAGWLPGFPWLTHALGTTGYSLPDAGLLISWVAMATALFLVWFGWGRDLAPGRALVLLLAFGLFPGSVYNLAFFPTSLALACTVGGILAAVRQRFAVGALLMTLAGLCYPSAWYAAIGLAIGMVVLALPLGPATVARRAAWGVAGLASLVILGVHDQVAFGHANAFFVLDASPSLRVQGVPGTDVVELLIHRDSNEQLAIGRVGGAWLAVQGLVAMGLVVTAGIVSGRRWRGPDAAARVYPALAGLAVVVGIIFEAAADGSWNRSVVLAAPCVVCLRRLPMAVLVPLVVVMGTVTAIVSHYFFNGTMI